jgi:hypothetical protein
MIPWIFDTAALDVFFGKTDNWANPTAMVTGQHFPGNPQEVEK